MSRVAVKMRIINDICDMREKLSVENEDYKLGRGGHIKIQP